MSTTETLLTEQEIVRAATNAPELSERSFKLGDREFKVVDLEYDSYLKFLSYVQPLLQAAASGLVGATEGFAVGEVIEHAGKALPNMVQLMCAATDPSVTVEEVKRMCNSPFKMASIVLLQLEQNQTISEIASFFGQILPILKAVKAKN